MTDTRAKCELSDGKFVTPCDILAEATDQFGGWTRGKGIARWEYTNRETHQPSRTLYGIKSKKFPNGLAFTTCPFCGENIDTHNSDETP